MWLFLAILFFLQAPTNSGDATEQKKALNPEALMNVVSRENFEFPSLKVWACSSGGERLGGHMEREGWRC